MKNTTKDRWSALSIKDRADLIKLYIDNGITDIKAMRKNYNGIPYRDFNTSEYDYFNAHPSNAPTKEGEHWTSRNPKTGQLLKREDHPTFDLMIEGEKQAGYNIVKGLDGNLYSIPNTPNNYVENYNSFGGGGDTKSFWQKILESGQSARDARVGAVGAQQVRDLYSEGKNEEAQKLAEQYAKANNTGISLAAGSISPSLLGDLAITGATTLADTLIEGDTKNLKRNFAINALGDIVGGAFQYAPKLYKWTKNKANDVLNINTFDDAVNSAVEFYKRNFNPDIKSSDFSIIEVDDLPKNVNGEYVHGSRWMRIGEKKNHIQQRGTIGHEIRHHEDADLNAPDEFGTFIIGDDAVYSVDYGRQKLTEEEKQILKKAYGETKIVEEHPAINVDFKEFLEEMYIKENGKIPSAEELNTYIENLPYQLVSLARGVSSYATPWSMLKTALFPNNAKKALTTVKKDGGKLNVFATGGPVEEGKEFLKEWYSSPTTQNMVEQVAPNNNIDINQTIESIKEFEATSNIPDEGLPALVKGINYFNLDKYVDRDVYRTNRKQALADAFTGSSIGAFYSRPHNSVVYQYGYYNPTNQVHEIDHGIQNAIPEISTPVQPVEHVLKKGVKADPYLDSKDENRSRIMELRMQQKLSPEKRDYTPKEAQKLVNTLKDSKLKGDLNRLTPETLAGYLNYLADADTFNSIPSYENASVNYAKDGGKLKLFATGGPTEEGGYSKTSNLYRRWRHHKLDPAGGLGLDQLLYLNNKSRGEEDQYWKAYLGLKNDVPKMLPSSKTEWDDKVEAEKIAQGELPSDFYGTTDNMDLYIQAMADTTTTGQIVRNYDAFKKANPRLAKKHNIEAMYNSGKAMMDNPGKWTQVGEVKGNAQLDIERGLNDGEEYPLGMLASFGAKWIPEENTIHVHDTYDFPLWSRILGRVPNRPKEMKIRGKVKYNPKNKAKLFNSENFDLNYPK